MASVGLRVSYKVVVASGAAALLVAVAARRLHRKRREGHIAAPPSSPPADPHLEESEAPPKANAVRTPHTEESSRARIPDCEADTAVRRRLEVVEDAPAAVSLAEMRSKLAKDNKGVVRAWELRERERALARLAATQARIAAQEAAGVKNAVAEKSKALLAARTNPIATEAGDTVAPEPSRKLADTLPAAPPPGATEASVAVELARWPRPPLTAMAASNCCGALLAAQAWPLYYDHFDWLDEVASRYAFADAGEVLRHLVFVANGETAAVKKVGVNLMARRGMRGEARHAWRGAACVARRGMRGEARHA